MKIVFFLPINYNGHHCRLLLMPDFFGFSVVYRARCSHQFAPIANPASVRGFFCSVVMRCVGGNSSDIYIESHIVHLAKTTGPAEQYG